MNLSSQASENKSGIRVKSTRVKTVLRSPYFLGALTAYLLISLLVIVYLRQDPVYRSDMSLVLPGSGNSSNFSIEDVGQANAQTKSPFSGSGFSPKVNYKEILKSRDVINSAASQLSIPHTQFGLPKVDLTEQSSILSVSIIGGSAEQAQSKAWSLYQAFQDQLDHLREDETSRQGEAVTNALRQHEKRLNKTRLNLVEFQQRSLLISTEQLEQATRSLSALNEKQMYALAELKSQESYARQLSADLGVSPALAGQAFNLNTDTQFRGYLRELDDSAARISTYKSHWGANHPKVKTETKRFEHARRALFQRSIDLAGEQVAETLHTMDLTVSPGRGQLFAELVEAAADVQASRAKIDEMRFAKQQLEDRLRIFARESAELERLERDMQLAEAVYTSAAARLDAGKADVFASYPIVQMLTPPSSPIQQKSPKLSLAIAGGLAGFIFVTLGVLMLWQRQYIIAQLLKKS